MNAQVSTHIDSLKRWKEEISLLREIVLKSGLEEAYKWRQPCYTQAGHNVLIVSGFKDYCFVSFLKGVLLSDPSELLSFSGDNSQSSKLLKFTTISEIEEKREIIKSYIEETIEYEKLGKKVIFKPVEDFEYPAELTSSFKEDSNFQKAFEALTKGRQKGYLLHFAGAKQSKTRLSRILSLKERILDGYGLRDCTCSHSKRMPQCDGSHKYL